MSEAIEEEVGDDEIVWAFKREVECAGVVGAETRSGIGCCCFAALAEELKHNGAGVDCIGLEVRVVREKLGEEAAVSIAQDQCVAPVEKLRKVLGAAALERLAKGEIFEPAIGFRDVVEVWFGGAHRGMKSKRRIGVVSARSAAARRVIREIESR